MQGGVGTLSRVGSWAAGCSWQAGRPGRYSFGEGRFLVDTAALPEMDGVAAVLPESLELEQGQGLEPGRREERNSDIVAAGAVGGQAEGLQAECYILWREKGREKISYKLLHRGKACITTKQLLIYD